MKVLHGNIEVLLAWAASFFTYLKLNMLNWGISESWEKDVEIKLNDLQNAHSIWINPSTKTKASHTAMIEKRKVFVKAVEPLIQNLRSLPTLQPSDYDILQIAPPSSGRQPKYPPPVTWPVLTLDVLGQCTADLRYHDINTPLSIAKPRGVHEAVIRIGFSAETPESVDDLTETPVTITRTPYRLVFPLDNAGKKLHAAGAWVNPTGERGPWGPIVSVILS
ncbi:MAG: hypothetical protein LBP64_06590 [Tannerella sp.]|jgi:hypothetical protein|nr:hypothetical protein [Tannerella sp.]